MNRQTPNTMGYDFRDLILQIFGHKNLFGYSKTILNQIRLIYWFLGEFYQSTIFNQFITLFWKLQNILAIITVIVHGSMFLLFSSNQSLSQMLFAIVVLIAVSYILIVIPLGSFLYHDHIIRTFTFLDQQDINTSNQKFNSWIPYLILTTQLGLPTLYGIITYYNLFATYDKNHLCNPEYFIFPLYCDYVQSNGAFLILQSTQLNVYFPGGPIFSLIPLFTYLVSREFHGKFQSLSNAIECQSELFKGKYEQAAIFLFSAQEMIEFQEEFLKSVHEFAKYHHTILREISHLRLYLEFNMSTSLVSLIVMEILVVFILLLVKKESTLLTVRFLVLVVVFAAIQFVYCLSAKFFDDMAETFKNAVLGIPWYYLPASSRKSIYLLLYQAQVNVEFKALKIYPLNMGFFLRSCNNVYSVVNVFRRRTANRNN